MAVVAPAGFDLASWIEPLALGPEVGRHDHKGTVYLVTFARVLAATLAEAPHLRYPGTLSRGEIRAAVWDAMENPEVQALGGRPRSANQVGVIVKMLVVRETHSDGSYHFHVAVKLRTDQR